MKKIISSFLLSIFVFVFVAQASFTDVSSVYQNYTAVNSLVDQGILEGYDDGTFLPENNVNRAEALKIILMGMEVESNESSVAGVIFTDVEEEDWFFNYVSTAVGLGIINGYDDGTFLPKNNVNRAEVMKMLMLAAGITEETPDGNPFVDVSSGSWFGPYADYAKIWNIEPPQTDGMWHPSDIITRANISEMVYRMQMVLENGIAFEESKNWLRKDFPNLDISMKVPFGWDYEQNGIGSIWLTDKEHGQISPLAPYGNGGTLLMSHYANSEGKSADTLFEELERSLASSTLRTQMNGYNTLEVYNENGTYFREWYVYLDNDALVHLLALRGEGYYSEFLEDYIEAMVVSIEFAPGGDTDMTIEEVVGSLQSSIQVDGVGQNMMDYLTDWSLIETDAIGVGTGPVDYYYSPSANITVKYERSYDVILDIESGETSAF